MKKKGEEDQSTAIQLAVLNASFTHLSTTIERRISVVEKQVAARPDFMVRVASPVIAGLSLVLAIVMITIGR